MVRKLLVYTFLIDFVEYMHPFITEKDYALIDNMLGKLFAGGNCLLPYPVFCTRRATLGKPEYLTLQPVRITEDSIERITEDEYIRIA